MTVRGGKNRVLVYTGAGLLLVALVLFYHNAATKLEDARVKYEKCHLNEESQSAQLQVILEYKSRLEKSLQQEKSDYAQTKEEMRNKVEEERQTRERENLESINKFTALQQQYKLLKSQHEDVTFELEKAKQQLLTGEEERSHLEAQITSLTQQNKLLLDDRESDTIVLKTKVSKLEAENESLKKENNVTVLVKEKHDLERELSECLRNKSKTAQIKTGDVSQPEDTLNAPSLTKQKTSTAANKIEIVSGAIVNFNTSTPLINPDAVLSQDRTAPSGQIGKLLNIPAVGNYQEQQENADEIPRPNRQLPQAAPPVREIQRNQADNQAYEDEFDGRKEEEDDDADNMDFDHNAELAPAPAKAPPNRKVIIENSRDAVMVFPK